MIYELRIYRCVPNRLPALLKRFETNTLRIWEKHGIRQAGFWTTVIGESNQELTYLLAWESLAEREKKWAAFQTDPEWIAARDASEKDGPIVAPSRVRSCSRRRFRACARTFSAAGLGPRISQAVRPLTMRTIQINKQAPMNPRIR